jgi:hypothetical protein
MQNKSIPDLIRNDDLIQHALTKAVQETVRTHKLLGRPIVVWRDGKVVWVPPEEIELDEERNGTNGKK